MIHIEGVELCMKPSTIIGVYEFMAEQIEAGLCAIDEKGNVLVYNKKMRELTGETLEQAQQRTEQYLDFYNTKRLHLGIQFMTPLKKCCQGLELN